MRSEDERAADEATFREANEQIRSVQRELEPPIGRVRYLCECDDVRCRETIAPTAEEHERIRDDGPPLRSSPATPARATRSSGTSTTSW